MDPLISVIVPFRDEENWIGRCIDSLRMQRGRFEFLLVDDHSTDRSTDIVREHIKGDSRFDFSHLTSLYGVSAARNAGIGNATGDWITFLDADDEMNENAYPRFMAMLEEDPDAAIYQANHLRWYEKTKRLAQKYNNVPGKYDLENLPQCWCMVWNKLYSSNLLKGIRFKYGLQYGEDELYNLCAFARLKRKNVEPYIHCSSELTMIKHFENKGSLAHTKGEAEILQQARVLTNFVEEHPDPEIRRAVLALLSEHWSSPTYKKILCGGE